MKEYYSVKLNYLSAITGRKLVLLAGSNGRFSHRCETIEKYIDMPCVNMSITANISLDYQFKVLKPYLNNGDSIYMPLEYGALRGSKKDLMSGLESPYIIAYDHASMIDMDFDRLVQGLFYFDIKFLFSALGEMLLQKLGVQRRFNVTTLTANGDERKHSEKQGRKYRKYLKTLTWSPPSIDDIDSSSYKANIVREFLKWTRVQNVRVFGALPTTFNDEPIPEQLITDMRNFYLSGGHEFIVLENLSQYPRSSFYDTAYHLNESNQVMHSRLLAVKLREILERH